jgi:Helix-turn-helix of DDE superfamily endonuclease
MPSYEDVIQRAGSVQAMTGFTQQEFEMLLPHFEHALAAYLQDRTIDGQPRTSRRYRPYDNCPLPTIADKLLFILTYVKQNPIQEGQGQLFGMSQSNANKWIHLLHAVLNHALAHQELLPARNADDLSVMLAAKRREGAPPPPLFGMMALSDRSTAPLIPRTSKNTTAARKSVTRLRTSS